MKQVYLLHQEINGKLRLTSTSIAEVKTVAQGLDEIKDFVTIYDAKISTPKLKREAKLRFCEKQVYSYLTNNGFKKYFVILDN